LDIEVVETKWADCWTPDGLGAKLADGTVDACMTYTHTIGLRPQFADFSYGILNVNKAAGFLTRLNTNGEPHVNGHNNLGGLNVVDVGGWAPTADGLTHVKNQCTGEYFWSNYKLLVADGADNNNDLALKMLLDGDADIMFVYADQAYNYKRECVENPDQPFNCSMWMGFGKTFAYVQTGQFGYLTNGTTLAMTKKGSGVAELLNPCLDQFMATEEYYKICQSYDTVDSCYPNSFFPSSDDITVHDSLKPTREHNYTDCSNGYCPCT
jgi:hypothetical protein